MHFVSCSDDGQAPSYRRPKIERPTDNKTFGQAKSHYVYFQTKEVGEYGHIYWRHL
uniref:PAW domain-containing protein n=1 Tax=Romanomermis culicivorax TaxID=13658 RepID=A0A915HST5_ROMCU